MEANQATSSPQPASRVVPSTDITMDNQANLRKFAPISYCVPAQGWDITPCELKPLSWYLTDNQVASIIYAVYSEVDFGRWKDFADKVGEAYVYFHPPYGHAARGLGYKNQDESLTLSAPVEHGDEDPAPVEQQFDANDIMQL